MGDEFIGQFERAVEIFTPMEDEHRYTAEAHYPIRIPIIDFWIWGRYPRVDSRFSSEHGEAHELRGRVIIQAVDA